MMSFLVSIFIRSGVPKGFSVGPLFYLIYVDTMRFYFLRAYLTSLADDTALTFSIFCVESLMERVNSAMAQIYTFTSLSLLLNKKTSFFLMKVRSNIKT